MKKKDKMLICLAGWLSCTFGLLFQSGFIEIPRGFAAQVSANGSPQLEECSLFPSDNIWNAPVDTLPVHPDSAAYIATIGEDEYVHADFGEGLWEGGPIGIPYVTVLETQPRVTVSFEYDDESDFGPYPIPADPPIEGGSDSNGDRHILIVDRDSCILYELFHAFPEADGSWTAGSGAIFDLKSNVLRPSGWTSADAAGLPILPGLVRYDEVAAGEIKHALRFTVPQTRKAYVWPARHYASSLTDLQYPPMGQRFRLRNDFDVSTFAPSVQVILKALKKYGMMLADNGSAWFISGVPDERWDNDVLRQLHQVHGSDFEAVDVSSLMVQSDSAQAKIKQPLIIDHTCTDIGKVPRYWIGKAKTDFKISYGHTSHGSQIVTGMNTLLQTMGSLYAFNHDGSSGALSLHDYEPDGDLGSPDRTTWAARTRTLLNTPGNDRNLVMWSWCGQVSTATEADINTYLNLMNQLETDYPGVTFVYMTGHLDGSGEAGNLHLRNNQIREYCRTNGKVLFDFADIESYNPDASGFLTLGANDACNYSGGNWADQWCGLHPDSVLCTGCGWEDCCAHSRPLNCNLKGRAFWWMVARLVGWNGQTLQSTSSGSIFLLLD